MLLKFLFFFKLSLKKHDYSFEAISHYFYQLSSILLPKHKNILFALLEDRCPLAYFKTIREINELTSVGLYFLVRKWSIP